MNDDFKHPILKVIQNILTFYKGNPFKSLTEFPLSCVLNLLNS